MWAYVRTYGRRDGDEREGKTPGSGSKNGDKNGDRDRDGDGEVRTYEGRKEVVNVHRRRTVFCLFYFQVERSNDSEGILKRGKANIFKREKERTCDAMRLLLE